MTTSEHEAGSKLLETSCPRCACHLVHEFRCNCGEIHGDVCENCGRFRSAGTRATELSITDEICTHGHVPHEHAHEEKRARIDRWYEFLESRRPAQPVRDMEEAKRQVEAIMAEYRRQKTARA